MFLLPEQLQFSFMETIPLHVFLISPVPQAQLSTDIQVPSLCWSPVAIAALVLEHLHSSGSRITTSYFNGTRHNGRDPGDQLVPRPYPD
jgi:hypothetical protein